MPPTAPFATAFVLLVGTTRATATVAAAVAAAAASTSLLLPTPTAPAATGLACFSARYIVRITSVRAGGAITRPSTFSPARSIVPFAITRRVVPLRVFLLLFQCFSDDCMAFFVLSIATEQVAVAGQEFVESDCAIARGVLFLCDLFHPKVGKKKRGGGGG